MHACMNEYVYNVNFAHKAHCNGWGQTLHFFSHANMAKQMERSTARHLIHLQKKPKNHARRFLSNVITESKRQDSGGTKTGEEKK